MLRLNLACVYCFEHNLCQSHTHIPNPIQYKHMHTHTNTNTNTRTLPYVHHSTPARSLTRALVSPSRYCAAYSIHHSRVSITLDVNPCLVCECGFVCVCVSMMRKAYTPRYLYAHIYDLSMSVDVGRKITILALLVPISKKYTIFTCIHICLSGALFER